MSEEMREAVAFEKAAHKYLMDNQDSAIKDDVTELVSDWALDAFEAGWNAQQKRIEELETTLAAVKGWLNKCEAEAFETANPFLMGAIGHALAEISEGGADE